MPIYHGKHISPPRRVLSHRELRRLMDLRGWETRHLVQFSGIRASTLEKIVCGQRSDPRISTVDRIAAALEVPIDALLEFDL